MCKDFNNWDFRLFSLFLGNCTSIMRNFTGFKLNSVVFNVFKDKTGFAYN